MSIEIEGNSAVGAGGGGGLYTLRETIVLSMVSSVDVLDLTRSEYLLKFRNILLNPLVDDAFLFLECSNDNGSTFITSNYQYVSASVGMDGGTSKSEEGAAGFIEITPESKKIGFMGPTAFEYGASGEIKLTNVFNATQPMYVYVEAQIQDKDRKGHRITSAGMTTDKNATVATFNTNAVKIGVSGAPGQSMDSGTIEVWETTIV